jgi:hypothetical protein
MRHITRPSLSPATALAGIAVVVSIAGAAFGSSPDGSGQFTGCAKKKSGALRLVDTAKKGKAGKCRHSERQVTWSQRGPTGTSGQPGEQGIAGTNGAAGLDGKPGLPGTALGFARVNAATSPGPDIVDDSKSKNVGDANVTRMGIGSYCFKDLPFTPRNAVAEIDATSSGEGDVTQIAFPATPTCTVRVDIFADDGSGGNEFADSKFYVLFN